MRISTQNFFDASIQRLNEVQNKLDQTSQQISSGRKLTQASDDPVAATQVLALSQSQAINTQFAKNREYLRNQLSISDGALTSINDVLQSINEQVVAAGNGSFSASDRASIAQTLQGQRDQLLALANTTDGAGHYLFAGQKTDTVPYTVDASTGGVSWQGDPQSVQIAADSSLRLATGVSGVDLFASKQADGTVVDSVSFFTQLNTAISALNDPSSTPASLASSLKNLGDSFSTTLQQVTDAQASIGTRLQQLDYQDQLGQTRDSQYTASLSKLQDLDYNKALSDLARQQLILQAAQKTFAQLSDLSLFSFIR